MVYDEPFFLPVWLRHYGEEFGYENLYVIDDGSTDGSTGNVRAGVMRRPRGLLDENERADLVSLIQMALLRHYDVVIYTDVDELIIVDPANGMSLRRYLEAQPPFEFKNVVGFNVLHRTSREPAIDLARPIFHQRRYVQFSIRYSKPLVTRTPLRWATGFHEAWGRARHFDLNLFLFHLRTVDMAIALDRLQNRKAIQFSERSLRKGHSVHFRLPERQYLEKIGYPLDDAAFRMAETDMEVVPPLLEALLNGSIPYHAMPEPILEVPARFADALILGAPSPAPVGAPKPLVDPQELMRGALRLLPRSA